MITKYYVTGPFIEESEAARKVVSDKARLMVRAEDFDREVRNWKGAIVAVTRDYYREMDLRGKAEAEHREQLLRERDKKYTLEQRVYALEAENERLKHIARDIATELRIERMAREIERLKSINSEKN